MDYKKDVLKQIYRTKSYALKNLNKNKEKLSSTEYQSLLSVLKYGTEEARDLLKYECHDIIHASTILEDYRSETKAFNQAVKTSVQLGR
jgi:hypothetical protein